MKLEHKANLIVIIISFVFGSALFVITIIAGFIMEHYLFGVIGTANQHFMYFNWNNQVG